MASNLINILNVTGAPGAVVVTAHGLNIEGVATIPDKVELDNGDYVITAVDATNVTVRNNGALGAVCNIECRIHHSVGDSAVGGALSPIPFLPDRVRGGGGALGVFGDGSDGDVVHAAPAAITRDMYYNSLDVQAAMDTAGFRVFVRGNLTVSAVMGRPGNAGGDGAVAAAGAAGAALAAASIGASAIGGLGGATGVGAAGTAIAESWGGDSGSGGTSTSNAGGAVGVVTNPIATSSQPRTLPAAVTMLNYETLGAITDILGGAGGGGGGAEGASGGGGGGGGGGVVMIAARNINIEAGGVISAVGGAGGDGFAAADAGGGGGGGGGVISLVYENLANAGAISAAGGAAGVAGGGGASVDGVAGDPGTVFQLDMKA